MWLIRVVSDVSVLVSDALLPGAPPAAPTQRTETARLSHTSLHRWLLFLQPLLNKRIVDYFFLSGSKMDEKLEYMLSYSILTGSSLCLRLFVGIDSC